MRERGIYVGPGVRHVNMGEVWLVGLDGSKQMVYESDARGPQRWCTGMRLMVYEYAIIMVLMLYKITQSHLILHNPTNSPLNT